MIDFHTRVATIFARTQERMRSEPRDGLLLAMFRLLFGAFMLAWGWIFYVPILRMLERPSRCLAGLMTASQTDEDVYWVAIDLYKALMTGLSVGLYVFLWHAHVSSGPEQLLAGVSLGFASLRLLEYIAVVGLHFFSYASARARESFRPVANAFWSYIEIAVLYGLVYEALVVRNRDAVVSSSGEGMLDAFLNPLYFSFITLATIGYGDFTPHSTAARAVAMTESFVGMFLIVAIIQKALSRTPA
jgi:hypothetical protein